MSTVHTRRGGRSADARGALERAHVGARVAAVRGCGPELRGDGTLTRRPVCERPRRSAPRPAGRHPRVRTGRRRPPGDHRSKSCRSRPKPTSSSWPRSATPAAPRGGCSRGFAAECDRGSRGLRVATAYPVSTRKLLGERGLDVELVPVSGSVEAAPRLGLADAIVDLVSTGSTLSANGLRLIGTLLASQAVLIGGRAASEASSTWSSGSVDARGVVAARRRRYVMMNAQAVICRRSAAILPSMGAPTVLPLAEEGRSRSRCGRRGRRLDALPALQAGGRVLDPRPAGRTAGPVRGTAAR